MFYAEIFKLHDWAMRTHHISVLIGGFIMYMAENGGSASMSKFLNSVHSYYRRVESIYDDAEDLKSKRNAKYKTLRN